MPDDEQEANCILGICCGRDGKQLKALMHWLMRNAGLTQEDAHRTGALLLDAWDFAPKNSLVAYRDRVAYLARGNNYE